MVESKIMRHIVNSKLLLVITLLVMMTVQLKMRDNNHHEMPRWLGDKHQKLIVTHHANQHNNHHYTQNLQQTHFATNSMQINYTQQITKLSTKLIPAANINDRLIKVNTEYLDHDDGILLLANFTFSQLNTSDISCKNTSANIIQSLLYRTSQMRTQLQSTLETNQVNFISNLTQREQAKQSIQNQIIYLQALQKFLESGCSKNVIISKTFYVSNPNANNWVLGDQTYDQFIKSYLNLVNSQQNVNKCPLNNPFYDSSTNDCVNCVYPNNIWNMKLQKCSNCPYAQVVNLKTRTCVSQIKYVNNIMDENYAWITKEKNLQKVYEQFKRQTSQQFSVVCPFDTPFILNEKCSTCPDKFVYSLQERKCMAIPFRMEYDRNLHKVVQRLQNYQTSEGISSNIVQGLKGCPNQFPYYDDVTCIDCKFPNYFNQRRRRCQPCVNLDFCAGKKLIYVTNSLAPNVTARSTKQVKDYFNENADKMKDDSIQQCPIATPYYNPSERKCIQCPVEKNLFNISSLTCVSCPAKSYFNQTTYLCVEPKGQKTYSKATNLIVDNITKYNEQQSKIKGVQCSEVLPYFNGKQCQSCSSGQLFNTSSKSCVVCPAGTSYDNVMMKCDVIKYKTNSKADRLWIKNKTFYDAQYKKNTAKQCPSTQPFYSGTACIKCSNEQIFNTTSLKCTKCPSGTTFDNINKNCSQSKANLYVPGKTDNLLGVPSYSVDAYLKELSNPDQKLYNVTKCADDQNSIKSGCVKCNDKYPLFNVKTLECVQCKNFNQTLKICYDNMTFLTNTSIKDKFLGAQQGDVDQYIKEQETKVRQNPDLYLICPSDKPFSINGQCQNCDKFFNVSSNQCTVCDTFDSISSTCAARPYVSNLKYGVPPYYTKNATRMIEQYDKANKTGTPICPFTKPFFNGKQCIVCPKTDQYFNLDTKRCENCSAGYQFNPIIYQCQQQPPKFYTPLESEKLIFDGQPISYYEYKIQQAKKAESGPCPKNTPYYTMNNKCEVCKSPKQYFNLLRRICTSCPENTTYNPTDHECESPIGDVVTPQPTLEKSLANSFT